MSQIAIEQSPANTSSEVAKTLTDAQATEIVGEINELAIETVERGMLEIGDLILNKVFQGSLGEATSRNPLKSKSMKQIADHKQLRVDRRRLGEWVRAANLRQQLIAKSVDCSNLSYSHFAALLRVKDDNKRQTLAATANEKQWKARHLANQVNEMNKAEVAEGDAQESDLPSDMTAGRLLTALANPRILMEDKEAQRFLGNPQDLEKLSFDVRMQVARDATELFNCMVGSMDLLKLAKKNIALIELGLSEPIDVQADEV
jgi:hypothetical protein